MKKIQRGMLKLTQKVAGIEIAGDLKNWPPYCSGIFHQPRRPENSAKNLEKGK